MIRKLSRSGRWQTLFAPGLALAALLAIAGYAVMGPTGLLAWSEYRAQLGQRQVVLSKLEEKQAALENRVALLDPDGADPDLVGELLRGEQNVVHPDEIIIPLK